MVPCPRLPTARERAVLTALLAENFSGVELLRAQAAGAQVFGACVCGCPSIDFFEGRDSEVTVVVNAGVKNSETCDGVFLFTVGLPSRMRRRALLRTRSDREPAGEIANHGRCRRASAGQPHSAPSCAAAPDRCGTFVAHRVGSILEARTS